MLPYLEEIFQAHGRWVGDRVTVFGDYTDVEDFGIIEKMCPLGWNDHVSCIHEYVDSFTDITDKFIPAFGAACGVEILDTDFSGHRTRKLIPSMWSWLFPDLQDDKKAATV